MIETIKNIITDNNFLGAILTSLSFITLAFILRHKNIINNSAKEFLSFLVLKIALPAMAFSAFMTDFDSDSFKKNFLVFLISLLLYIVFLIVCRLLLFKVDKSKRSVIAILMVVGQLTFFAVPVLKTIYSDVSSLVMIPANMMTLAFRIILYIYCYFTISRLKFTKKEFKTTLKNVFLNPVMIAMLLGLIIWLTQGFMPKVGNNPIFRIDLTLPFVYTVITTAEKLTTPLAMMVIGCILGEANITSALKDKLAWIISVVKTLIIPIAALLIIMLLQKTGLTSFSEYDIVVIVMGFGAPLSAVVSTYCSKFNNEMELASRVCFISTIICIITYPLLFVIIKLF